MLKIVCSCTGELIMEVQLLFTVYEYKKMCRSCKFIQISLKIVLVNGDL